jgi:hypothetical protein
MSEEPNYLDLALDTLSHAVVAPGRDAARDFCRLAAAYIILARHRERIAANQPADLVDSLNLSATDH